MPHGLAVNREPPRRAPPFVLGAGAETASRRKACEPEEGNRAPVATAPRREIGSLRILPRVCCGTMRCPRESSELKTRTYESNIEVDECPACAGVFLEAGELEAIQQTIEQDHRRALSETVDTVTEGFAAARNEVLAPVDCPKCGRRMERRRYGLGSQTVIDECAEGCGGVWLDGGELEQLEQFFERSNQEVSIPFTWRLWAAVRGAMKGKARPAR